MTILSIDSGIERTGYAIFKDKKYVTSAPKNKDGPYIKRVPFSQMYF